MSESPREHAEHLYDVIRSQIEHEDNQIAQRVNWFVASQSFLFSAYAIVLSNLGGGKSLAIASQQHLLVLMIPILATGVCVLAFATVVAGEMAIRHLRRRVAPFQARADADGLPPVQGIRRTQVLGMFPPLLLPIIFCGVWTLMLWHGLACGLHP